MEKIEKCEKLGKVKELLIDPIKWTKKTMFRRADGSRIEYDWLGGITGRRFPKEPPAAFCFVSACSYAGFTDQEILEIFGSRIFTHSIYEIADWNDDEERTHSDIINLLDEVIKEEC